MTRYDRKLRRRASRLRGSISQRVLAEVLEPRVLLSADLFPIAGAISAPGEEDRYAITMAEPARVTFDALSNSELTWVLQGPDGTDLRRDFDSSDGRNRGSSPIIHMMRGEYTLTVSGQREQTGDYAFELKDLDDATTLTEDTPTTATLTTGRETEVFTFDAEAGEAVYLGFADGTDRFAGTWALIDPLGAVIDSDTQWRSEQVDLTRSGSYTLLIEGPITADAPASAAFEISLSETEEFAYTPGTKANGAFAGFGDVHLYRFSVAADADFQLSGAPLNGSLDWRIRGANGQVAAGSTTFPNPTTPQALSLEAGEYVLMVKGRDEQAPSYDFLLEETGAFTGTAADVTASAQAVGDILDATLTRDGELRRFDFTLTQAQAVRFELLATNTAASLELISETGTLYSLTSLSTDQYAFNRFDLEAGTYSLVVRAKSAGAGQVRMRLVDDDQATAHDPASGPLVAVLDENATQQRFTLAVQSGDRIVLDAQGGTATQGRADTSRWRIYDPLGREVLDASSSSFGIASATATMDGDYIVLARRPSNMRISELRALVKVENPTERALTLGQTEQVDIATPGEVVNYRFTLDQPGQVLFDYLETDSRYQELRYNILDRDGVVIANKGLTLRDVYDNLHSLGSGDYILQLYGNSDDIGQASFRVLSVGDVAPTAPGTQLTGTLDPGGEALVLAVDAEAGQRIALDVASVTGPNTFYSVRTQFLDPLGNHLGYGSIESGDSYFDAPQTGRYLILIDSQPGQSQPITYDFTLRDVPTHTKTLAVGETVADHITVPFGRIRYDLTVDRQVDLHLDQVLSAPLDYTIFDASGNELDYDTRRLDNWDPTGRLTRLEAGSYQVVFEGRGNATSDVNFTLRDLATGGALPLDAVTTVNGTGPATVYRFDAGADDNFYFDYQTGNGNGSWLLLDPSGEIVFNTRTYNDHFVEIARAGTYTLIVDRASTSDDPFSTTFRVTKPQVTRSPLAVGAQVRDTMAAPRDRLEYALSLTQDTQVYLDVMVNSAEMQWSLLDAAGNEVEPPLNFNGGATPDRLMHLAAGDYTLVVQGTGDYFGPVDFALLDAAGAIPLADNTATDLRVIEPSRADDLFYWDGTAGDIIELEVLAGTGNKVISIIAPSGAELLYFNSLRDFSDLRLRETGRYLIAIQGYLSNSSDDYTHAFVVRKTGTATTEAITGTPVTLGQTVTGATSAANTPETYQFTLTERTRMVLDGQTNTSGLSFAIADALGRVVEPTDLRKNVDVTYNMTADRQSRRFMDLGPGTYQVSVSSTAATASFAFRLLDLAAGTPLTAGASLTLSLDPANMMQVVTIPATAGELVDLSVTSDGDFQNWLLLDPRGRKVAADTSVQGYAFTPQIAGDYTLLIDGRVGNTVPRTVKVGRKDGVIPIQSGQLINASFESYGATEVYALTLTAATQLIKFRFWARRAAPVLDFQVLDLGAPTTAITIDTEVTLNLPVATDTAIFNFEGVAGQPLRFDLGTISQSSYGSWLYVQDPDGSEIHRGDFDIFTPQQDGTYKLVMIPPAGRSGSLDLTFTLRTHKEIRRDLAFDERVKETLPEVGGFLRYDFTKATDGEVYFDSLTNDSSLRWRIIDGHKQIVADLHFAQDRGLNSRVFLAAGDYELLVYDTADDVPEAAFRLLEFASLPQITPGQPVQAELDPGALTRGFRFDGQAGQWFFADVTLGGSIPVNWQLIAPSGKVVFNTDPVADVAAFELSETGEYVLLFEGRVHNTTPRTVRANLLETPRRTNVPASSAARNAADLVPQGISVAAAGSVQAGAPVTISWQVSNQGSAAVAPGRDRVILRRADTREIVGLAVTTQAGNALGVGATLARQVSLTLPSGALGSGDLIAEVEVDIANDADETDGGVAPEQNNIATFAFTALSDLLPDLIVRDLTISPASGWDAGESVTISWTTENRGQAPVSSDFVEQLRIRNGSASFDPAIVVEPVPYSVATGGALGVGETRARSVTVTWPTNANLAVGEILFDVITDLDQAIAEGNDDGTGETNNTLTYAQDNAPDALVQDLMVTQTDLQAGDQVTITWNMRNNGSADTPHGWTDRVRLYNTTTRTYVVQQDIVFDVAGDGPIAPGETRARSLTFNLPDGQNGAGDFWFDVQADVFGNLRELNAAGNAESNNRTVINFSAAKRAYPDLAVSGLTLPGSSGQAGGAIDVSWTVTNTGSDPAGTRTDRVVLSVDDTIGNGDDIVLGNLSAGALAPGAARVETLRVTLPDTLDGDYTLAVLVDAEGAVVEGGSEDNNRATAALNVQPGRLPDLQVEAVAGPIVGSWEETVSISWRVGNDGLEAASGDWTDQVFLSTDRVLDGADQLLLERKQGDPLAPGGSYTATADVHIPGGITNNYYLIVVTDSGATVGEGAAEGNNTTAALEPMTISARPTPDLIVADITAPDTVSPGAEFEVRWRVNNVGEAEARAPYTDRVYLTQSGGLSGARYLGEIQQLSALAAGQGYDASLTATMPVVADGDWRILVITDFYGQVYEQEREDNDLLDDESLTLSTPDLQVTNFSAADTAASGDVLGLSWTITNLGGGTAAQDRVDRIYLSRDGTVDGADLLLHERSAGLLDPGSGETFTQDVILPIDANGAYQLLLVTDATDVVEEKTAEDNNRAARGLDVSLSPFSNLAVSDVTAPSLTVADPATITVGWTVTNISDQVGRETGWTDRVMASRDDVIGDGDDFVLGEYDRLGRLAPGAAYVRSEQIALPPGFSDRLRIYVVADARDEVFENGLKADNTAEVPYPVDVANRPYADLTVSSISAGAAVLSGQALDVSWTVRNDGIGSTSSSSWRDRVILSRNPDGSGHIATESYEHLGFLANGDSYTRSGTIEVPDGTEGTVYVRVETGGPYEFIYTDNNRSSIEAVTVALAPSPDLQVADIATFENAVEGDEIDIAWRVVNAGLTETDTSWSDAAFLESVDGSRPSIYLGRFGIDRVLQPGESYQRTERVTLPARIEGAYRLEIVIDVDNRVFENGVAEDNNRGADDRSITLSLKPRPNLTVASVVTAANVSAGGSISVEFEVLNQGAIEATGAWKDRVYLSLDDQLSSDDILISETGNPLALANGERYAITSAVGTVPLRWSGEAYVLVSTDARSNVVEYPFEADNVRAEKFTVTGLPRPDLVTSDVVAPAQAVYGSEVELRYTVTNLGAGATLTDTWRDTIWIARDPRRPNTAEFADVAGADFLKGNSARLLTTVTHTGFLAVGESYEMTVRVRIPENLPSGTYFLTPWSDSYDVVQEDTLAININPDDPNAFDNNNYKGRQIDILGFEPVRPDLVVQDVSTDGPVATADGSLTVNWTVRNDGLIETGDVSWVDRVYLSDKPTLGASGETLWNLGDVRRSGGLGAGQSYVESRSFDLPPSAAGQYVHVITDASIRGRQGVVEEDETNNLAAGATDVTNQPADLRVIAVSASDGTRSGEVAQVTWTVENVGGPVWEGTEYWRDSIWLSRDPVFNRYRATLLKTIIHSNTGGLAAGGLYTETAEVTLPPGSDGAYYLHVATDVAQFGSLPATELSSGNAGTTRSFYRSSVHEATDDPTDNFGRGTIDVTYAEPDLVVSNLTLPSDAASGGQLPVTFTVSNQGTRATRENIWYDRVFLSRDGSLDRQDYMLGEFRRTGSLDAGDSYDVQLLLDVPLGLSGDFTIIVETDSTSDEGYTYQPSTIRADLKGLRTTPDDVDEFADEGNNRVSAALTLTAGTTPDLRIENLTMPQRAVVGQSFDLSYDVRNAGARATDSGWRDLIYLSRDETLDPRRDFYLGFRDHTVALDGGAVATVQSSFDLPRGIEGSYFVFVVTDPTSNRDPFGAVYEGGAEDNTRSADQPLLIEQTPPVDLIATDVTVSGGTTTGGPITVNWKISNTSDLVDAEGRWTDAVYLSRDGDWDIDDTFLGRSSHSGGLARGASVDTQLQATLPVVPDGSWRVIVRADARNEVFEGAGEANNDTAGKNPLLVQTPQIFLDTPVVVTLGGADELLYRIDVPPGETLQITLSGGNGDAQRELFVKANGVPSPSDFDAAYSSPFERDQVAVVPTTQAGAYYILVRSFGAPGADPSDYTLTAQTLPFHIDTVTPDQGGSDRFVTMTLTGAGIKEGAIAKLSRPGIAEYLPVTVKRVDAAKLIAVFDLRDAPHGLYDVVVVNADGAEAVEPYRYLIERQLERDVTVGIGGPRVIAAGQTGQYSVVLDSLTNVDTPYVHFTFGAPQMGNNDFAYNLPFLSFSTNVGNGATGAALYARDPALAEAGALDSGVEALRDVDELLYDIMTDPAYEVINGDLPWYLPFQFNVVAAATPMTRDEFIAAQKADAETLRQAVLADVAALPALQTLAADQAQWEAGFLAALTEAGLLREETDAPPVFEQTRVGSLVAALSQGLVLGPAEDEITSTGDLIEFYAKVREWYGSTPGQTAPIVRYDVRQPPNGLPYDVPVPELPQFADYDLGLSRPTTFAAFNVFAPWVGDGAVELPDFGSDATTGELIELDLDRFREIAGVEGQSYMRGPLAAGAADWVPGNVGLPHQIGFVLPEDGAQVAQEIRLITELDPVLEPRSFQLGGIEIGDLTVQVPPGRLVYQTDLDLSATEGFILRVSAGLDVASRTATWLLQAIDPDTGEVMVGGGLSGLLAPGEEGRVLYSVRPTDNAQTGDEVSASARVLFNVTAPEDTPVFTYRLDLDAPVTVSTVTRVEGTDDYLFYVAPPFFDKVSLK